MQFTQQKADGEDTERNSKQTKVLKLLKGHSDNSYCIHDVDRALPGLSKRDIGSALHSLKEDKEITIESKQGCEEWQEDHQHFKYNQYKTCPYCGEKFRRVGFSAHKKHCKGETRREKELKVIEVLKDSDSRLQLGELIDRVEGESVDSSGSKYKRYTKLIYRLYNQGRIERTKKKKHARHYYYLSEKQESASESRENERSLEDTKKQIKDELNLNEVSEKQGKLSSLEEKVDDLDRKYQALLEILKENKAAL